VGVTGVATAGDNAPPPRVQQILGVVASQHWANHAAGAGQLQYHSGPVMHTNTSYAIYWVPSGYSVSSDYESLIDRFFTDVAADSGKTSNVYYSDTQYSDGSGKISYSSHFGGYVVDTNPFPASGCSDTVSQTTVCLSDAQIAAEAKRVATAQGWPQTLSTEFFMFTAKNVGSCAGTNECSFSYYCAYHSNSGNTLYANMPYADTVPADCDAGQHPNNSDADATLNVTSHEHNESITDEFGNAWYDIAGYEDGDKCAWSWGKWLGGSGSTVYNQVINGHDYALQLEYSNADRGCAETGL
jgi:hypothetical protein